jgi:type VI secretion system protein ImpC
MKSIDEERRGAQVRWLLIGRFSPQASGRRFVAGGERFAEALRETALIVDVELQDRLVGKGTRKHTLAFAKMSTFAPNEVVAQSPLLRGLRALADEAATVSTSAPFLQRVRELVGDGALVEALRATLEPTAAAPAPSPASSGSVSVDDIFAKAELPAKPTAVAAVDAFVRSLRPDGAAGAKPKSGAAAARDLLLTAVQATTQELLGSPAVSAIEGAWRGLRLVAEAAATGSSMHLEVVDADAAEAKTLLQEAAELDTFERPDAVFVVDRPADVAALHTLAQLAETASCPVVTPLPAELVKEGEATVLGKAMQEPGELSEAWATLRQDESARWISVVANRPALVSDGTGANRRTTFGSPVFAVAAMIAASYRETGTFGRLYGGSGALKGPALHEITSGRNAGTSLPVETFVSLESQGKLTTMGLVALGSGRNSDKITLSAAPTLRRSSDAVSLPSQVLTGRVVRFAQWVRGQIPPGSGDAEVGGLFRQAAEVFLFPSPQMGSLDAKVVDLGGRRAVAIGAQVRGDAAAGLSPFQIAFTLGI